MVIHHSSRAALQVDHLAASAPALHLTAADETKTYAHLPKGPIGLPYMLSKVVGHSIADLTGPAFGIPALFLRHHSVLLVTSACAL